MTPREAADNRVEHLRRRLGVDRATQTEVAAELGITPWTVWWLAKKHNIERPSRAEALAKSNSSPEILAKKPARAFLTAATAYEGDDCLIWPYWRDKKTGAACVKYEGRDRTAANVVCELVYGPPPTPKHQAAHSCGRGHLGCVNGRHLRWATNKENSEDRRAHGTMIYGESNPACKFTEAEIERVREMAGSMPKRTIARSLGISEAHVHSILKGERRSVKQDALNVK